MKLNDDVFISWVLTHLLPIDQGGTDTRVKDAYASYPLKAFLDEFAPKDFNELTLGVSLYEHYLSENLAFPFPAESLKALAWPDYKHECAIVSSILFPSRGILVWNWQIESLFLCFSTDQLEAINFRKCINAKRIEYFAKAEQLCFPEGVTLHDIIIERMVLNHTQTPKYALIAHFNNEIYPLVTT